MKYENMFYSEIIWHGCHVGQIIQKVYVTAELTQVQKPS